MDVFEAISQRRSIRNFQDAPVPRADLERIVRAGIEAPSGCNMQLRQFIIVDDPDVVAQLQPLGGGAMRNCPAVIVVVMQPASSEFGEYWIQDSSAAVENMLLAATAMGYGTCWVEGGLRGNEDEVRRILNVDEEHRAWVMIPVGKPAETPSRPRKSAPEKIIHFNSFGSTAEG